MVQMESFGLIVDDRAQSNGGTQCIVNTKGYIVPLHIRKGLPYLDMTVPTDDDLDCYPHVFFTSDTPWDPSVLDQEFSPPKFDMPSTALARWDALGELCYAHQAISAFPQMVCPRLPDLDFLKHISCGCPMSESKPPWMPPLSIIAPPCITPFASTFARDFPLPMSIAFPNGF